MDPNTHMRYGEFASKCAEFEVNDHWVIHKIAKRFSAMPIDQAHKQNNEIVKSFGGAIGLTENPSVFRKWIVSGPIQLLSNSTQ